MFICIYVQRIRGFLFKKRDALYKSTFYVLTYLLSVRYSVALLYPSGEPRRWNRSAAWTTLAYIQSFRNSGNSSWSWHHWKGRYIAANLPHFSQNRNGTIYLSSSSSCQCVTCFRRIAANVPCCCCCCYDKPATPRHQALPIWGDKEVSKRWGIPPDSESGGIRLSLVVVDSHLLTGAPLKGGCRCPQLTYCQPLSNNRCWRCR